MLTGAVSANSGARETTGHVAIVYMVRGQLVRPLRQSAEPWKVAIGSLVLSPTWVWLVALDLVLGHTWLVAYVTTTQTVLLLIRWGDCIILTLSTTFNNSRLWCADLNHDRVTMIWLACVLAHKITKPSWDAVLLSPRIFQYWLTVKCYGLL